MISHSILLFLISKQELPSKVFTLFLLFKKASLKSLHGRISNRIVLQERCFYMQKWLINIKTCMNK